MRVLLTCAFAAALSVATPALSQQRIEALGLNLTATPVLSSDYLFRGISQTRNRPALQMSLDVAHDSGAYVGAFASNVAFQGTDARQEVDVLAGYRFAAASVNWDIGGIYYAYPGYSAQPGQYVLDYAELALRASREFGPVKLLASANWSPNFFGRSGTAWYVEGGADITLPFDFLLSGRAAYQWIARNERFGTPDYAWWSIGVSRPLPAGFTVAVGWYDTSLARDDCAGGQKICGGRVLVSLSRAF